jgi:hypothetical protein
LSSSQSIEFVLRGDCDGVAISPSTISFPFFNQFNSEVEILVGGSDKQGLGECHVTVQEGSYKLVVLLSVVAFASFSKDLTLLQREDSLGEIDPRRADVVTKWQSRAKNSSSLSFEIRPREKAFHSVVISNKSDFHVGDVQPWVTIEKYLFGQIVDMGGANKANVHLRLHDSGKIIKIDTTQAYLERQSANRLYHKTLLQVRAEQHYKTGTWRNVQLIGFVDYEPKSNDDALDRFAEEGAKAWGDVKDAAKWLRELRGGK